MPSIFLCNSFIAAFSCRKMKEKRKDSVKQAQQCKSEGKEGK
jgi:hypothetical protein